MKVIRHNDVCFRGQFADALEKLLNDEVIDINSFHNGSYESNPKMKRFLVLIRQAEIKVDIETNENESIRSMKIKLKK